MFFILVILAGLLQVTVFRYLNLLLILAIFAAFKKGPFLGGLISALLGTYLGILTGSHFGSIVLIFLLIGIAAGSISSRIFY